MKRQRRRRRGFSSFSLIRSACSTVSGLTSQPLRVGLLSLLISTAIWAILTKSLPYALASSQPDLALKFNPNNPVALVTKAESLRTKLPALATPGNLQHAFDEKRAITGEHDQIGTREALRGEIRKLVLRAISNDPLNTRAFRLLAEISDGTDQIRMLMQKAFRRSRRESVAAFWLLNDAFYIRDYRAAVYYADILLRTRPQLDTPVFSYLSVVADDNRGREELIAKLATHPVWRTRFFEELPSKAKSPETPLAVMTALQDLGKPLTQKEIEPYLDFLINNGKIELAYNVWLQSLPTTDLENIGLLTNASFEREPSGLPFDWRFGKGNNALAEIVWAGEEQTVHVLHIAMSDGRVQFPEVSQTILLKPGRYRFEGKLRGSIVGKRGLRWQLRCLPGAGRVLSETEMLMGQFQQWRFFKLEVEVPDLEECRGQVIRLFHDSRSASEQLLSGEVWLSDLRLERLANKTD
jgi:hypothetical protein